MVWSLAAAVVVSFTLAVRLRSTSRTLRSVRAALADAEGQDLMTGVLSRAGVSEAWRATISAGSRHDEPTGAALVDVDGMAAINHRDGEVAGDSALLAVGQTLRRVLRAEDSVGRWSGDSFLVVLPRSGLAETERTCLRLREAITQLVIPRVQASPLEVTVSIGCSAGGPSALDRAEEALAAAQARGDTVTALPAD